MRCSSPSGTARRRRRRQPNRSRTSSCSTSRHVDRDTRPRRCGTDHGRPHPRRHRTALRGRGRRHELELLVRQPHVQVTPTRHRSMTAADGDPKELAHSRAQRHRGAWLTACSSRGSTRRPAAPVRPRTGQPRRRSPSPISGSLKTASARSRRHRLARVGLDPIRPAEYQTGCVLVRPASSGRNGLGVPDQVTISSSRARLHAT